jgi:hypothetical protein
LRTLIFFFFIVLFFFYHYYGIIIIINVKCKSFLGPQRTHSQQYWSIVSVQLAHALWQRFSNYGPRTTSGPRVVASWSFKKDRRKNRIQMNCVSRYSWKSQNLEITHGNRLSLTSIKIC